jgi:hypothetical protein
MYQGAGGFGGRGPPRQLSYEEARGGLSNTDQWPPLAQDTRFQQQASAPQPQGELSYLQQVHQQQQQLQQQQQHQQQQQKHHHTQDFRAAQGPGLSGAYEQHRQLPAAPQAASASPWRPLGPAGHYGAVHHPGTGSTSSPSYAQQLRSQQVRQPPLDYAAMLNRPARSAAAAAPPPSAASAIPLLSGGPQRSISNASSNSSSTLAATSQPFTPRTALQPAISVTAATAAMKGLTVNAVEFVPGALADQPLSSEPSDLKAGAAEFVPGGKTSANTTTSTAANTQQQQQQQSHMRSSAAAAAAASKSSAISSTVGSSSMPTEAFAMGVDGEHHHLNLNMASNQRIVQVRAYDVHIHIYVYMHLYGGIVHTQRS